MWLILIDAVRRLSLAFGNLLANVPSPSSELLDDLGCDGNCEGYPDEEKALVNSVGKGKLCPQTCDRHC